MFKKMAKVMKDLYLLDLDCRASEYIETAVRKKGEN